MHEFTWPFHRGCTLVAVMFLSLLLVLTCGRDIDRSALIECAVGVGSAES